MATLIFAVLAAGTGAGAAGASATACTAAPAEFEGVSTCKAGTTIHSATLEGSDAEGAAVLTTSAGTISCSTAALEAEIEASGEYPEQVLGGELTDLSLSGCAIGGSECKEVGASEFTNPGAPIEFDWIQTEAPQASALIQKPTLKLELRKCSIFQLTINCEYMGSEGEEIEASITNPAGEEAQRLEISAPAKKSAGGVLCPGNGTLEVDYEVSASDVEIEGGGEVESAEVWMAAL